jgi:transcriptional regulator with PAS, ATPase and Fis domain
MANRGTLFLDEIGEMPLVLQPKLLRVLEDRRVRRLGGSHELTVDVRVIAATNRDAQAALEQGKLRRDLYHRLNVFTLVLPPLRDRQDDLPLLITHFIRDFNRKHKASVEGVRESTLDLMRAYGWPGNIRELRNVLERAVILATKSWIEPHHLPPYVTRPPARATARR